MFAAKEDDWWKECKEIELEETGAEMEEKDFFGNSFSAVPASSFPHFTSFPTTSFFPSLAASPPRLASSPFSTSRFASDSPPRSLSPCSFGGAVYYDYDEPHQEGGEREQQREEWGVEVTQKKETKTKKRKRESLTTPRPPKKNKKSKKTKKKKKVQIGQKKADGADGADEDKKGEDEKKKDAEREQKKREEARQRQKERSERQQGERAERRLKRKRVGGGEEGETQETQQETKTKTETTKKQKTKTQQKRAERTEAQQGEERQPKGKRRVPKVHVEIEALPKEKIHRYVNDYKENFDSALLKKGLQLQKKVGEEIRTLVGRPPLKKIGVYWYAAWQVVFSCALLDPELCMSNALLLFETQKIARQSFPDYFAYERRTLAFVDGEARVEAEKAEPETKTKKKANAEREWLECGWMVVFGLVEKHGEMFLKPSCLNGNLSHLLSILPLSVSSSTSCIISSCLSPAALSDSIITRFCVLVQNLGSSFS